jgi:cytochrome c
MIRVYATGLAIVTLLIDAPQALLLATRLKGSVYSAPVPPCHSLRPDQNMTGPNLAGLWNRKAGTLASFSRHSPAMKSADIEWNDKTLDEWIEDRSISFPAMK